MHLSFQFVDMTQQRKLVALLKRAKIKFRLGRKGEVLYSKADVEIVENDLICRVRDEAFPAWQLVFCPADWIEAYRGYMTRNDVPFKEELMDSELCFLIPRQYRPHSWKLEKQTDCSAELNAVR